jgi:hypothetical protein
MKYRIDKVIVIRPDMKDEVLEPCIVLDEKEVFQYKKLIKYQYDAETINLVKTELP